MKAFVKKLMICFYRILNVILPKSNRMIVFSTSNGKAAGGNPRAIYEYAVHDIAQKGLKMKLVWFLTDELMAKHPEEAAKLLSTAENAGTYDLTSNDAPGNKEKHFNIKEMSVGIKRSNARIGRTGSTCRIVRYHHPLYYWYMARAGAWIFDSRQEPYIAKRSGVRYLQTWHGTPLKKLGLDIDELNMAGENIDTAAYQEAFKREAAQWDYLIAQNDFSAETFRRCFDFKGKMLKIGYPRNDVLVRAARGKTGVIVNNEKIDETGETDQTDKIDKNKKCITLLYAPTWRDDKYLEGGWYAYSSPLDFKKLYELMGRDYRIVIKPHYLVKM